MGYTVTQFKCIVDYPVIQARGVVSCTVTHISTRIVTQLKSVVGCTVIVGQVAMDSVMEWPVQFRFIRYIPFCLRICFSDVLRMPSNVWNIIEQHAARQKLLLLLHTEESWKHRGDGI